MKKWKLALLEDNIQLLKDYVENLSNIENIQVVVASLNSEDFLKKIELFNPDALLLDIDLNGDSMTGLDIAFKLKLPVLFVSNENGRHIKDFESLKRDYDLIVDHITKPFSNEDFIKTVKLFIKDIYIRKASEFKLPKDKTKTGIPYESIVFISSDKMEGSESNNKMIYFNDRLPQKLIDFSFSSMEKNGFDPTNFIKIHRSFRVNKNNIKNIDKSRNTVVIVAYSSSGKIEEKHLPISENYRSEIKKIF